MPFCVWVLSLGALPSLSLVNSTITVAYNAFVFGLVFVLPDSQGIISCLGLLSSDRFHNHTNLVIVHCL